MQDIAGKRYWASPVISPEPVEWSVQLTEVGPKQHIVPDRQVEVTDGVNHRVGTQQRATDGAHGDHHVLEGVQHV